MLMSIEAKLREAEQKLISGDNIEASLNRALIEFKEILGGFSILTPKDKGRIHNNIGFAFYQLRNFDEALVELELALGFNPKLVGAYINKAAIYNGVGQFQEALDVLELAKKAHLKKRPPLIYAHAGDAMRCLGRYEEAADNYKIALGLFDKKPQVYRGVSDYFAAIRAQKGLALLGVALAEIGIKKDYALKAIRYGIPQQQIGRIRLPVPVLAS